MIYKFQDGGASVPPFVSFTPVVVSRPRALTTTDSTASSRKSKSDDISLKDVLELIEKKVDALPNDASYIINNAKQFFADLALGVSPFGMSSGYNTSTIAMLYLNLLDSLTQAKHYKKEYDEAFKIVLANDGLNEVAVTSSGHLICRDPETGDFQLMTPKELRESGYIALTNSQLLDLRALAPENVMNMDLIKTVANGVGSKTISEFIEGRLKDLGHDKLEREGYSRTEANKIVEGLGYLQQAASIVGDAALAMGAPMTIDGIYKYSTLSDTQTNLAMAAINYIFTTMPNNMKAVLETKAELMGLNQDGRGVYNLIFQYVGSKVNNVNSTHVQASSDKDSLKHATKVSLNGALQALAGYGHYDLVDFNVGNSFSFRVLALSVRSPLSTQDLFSKVATAKDFNIPLDLGNVSFGGKKLDQAMFDHIWVNAALAHIVYLPVDLLELSDHNNIMPDFYQLKKMEDIAAEISKISGEHNPKDRTFREQVNHIYRTAGLPNFYDDNGEINTLRYVRFAALNADVVWGRKMDTPMWATEREGSVRDEIVQEVQKARGLTFDRKKRTPVYKGIVFAPVINDHFNAAQGTGLAIDAETASKIEALLQQRDRLGSYPYKDGKSYFEEEE